MENPLFTQMNVSVEWTHNVWVNVGYEINSVESSVLQFMRNLHTFHTLSPMGASSTW